MGYILPVNHEQYTQYANRTIRKDGPAFITKPVEKVTIRAKLKGKTNYQEKYEEAKQLHHDHDKEAINDAVQDQEQIDHCMADLTGKGTLFNEVI